MRGPPGAVQFVRCWTRVLVWNREKPSWCLEVKANIFMPLVAKRSIHSSALKPCGIPRLVQLLILLPLGEGHLQEGPGLLRLTRNGVETPVQAHAVLDVAERFVAPLRMPSGTRAREFPQCRIPPADSECRFWGENGSCAGRRRASLRAQPGCSSKSSAVHDPPCCGAPPGGVDLILGYWSFLPWRARRAARLRAFVPDR